MAGDVAARAAWVLPASGAAGELRVFQQEPYLPHGMHKTGPHLLSSV